MAQFRHLDTFPADATPFAHYDHAVPPAGAARACDIRAVLRRHEREWVDAFDRWHARLCALGLERTTWWWAWPASRPNLWSQSATLKPVFFAAAVRQWTIEHPEAEAVAIVGAPPEVRGYLEEFDGRAPGADPGGGGLRRGVRLFAAQAARLVPHLFRRARVRRCHLLVYSHVFAADALAGGGDHYFGRTLGLIEDALPGEVGVAYVVDGSATVAAASRAVTDHRAGGFLLLDLLTPLAAAAVAVRTLRAWIAVAALARRAQPLRLGAHETRRFGRRYVTEQGTARPPLLELAIHAAAARGFRRSRATTLLYPYEQKGLERLLLDAARARSPRVRTIGYAHPAHTRAHLMLRSRPAGEAAPPEPDLLLTPGPLERDFFVGWGGKPAAEVATLGSHRYRAPLPPRRSPRQPLRVLMITGHGFELSVLASLLERRPEAFGDAEVRVRRTAGGWFEAQAAGLRRLRAVHAGIADAGSAPLMQQIEWSDLILFSSTTAGIEAMLAGRLAIYVALHDVFEADPLLGSSGAFARCEDEAELAAALARARALSDDDYDAAVASQREFAARVLAPLELPRLLTHIDRGAAVASASASRAHAGA